MNMATSPVQYQLAVKGDFSNQSCILKENFISAFPLYIIAKNFVIGPGVRVQCPWMMATCSENFITVGHVDTRAVYIQAEKIYFGGSTTTLPENVHLVTPFEPSLGDDEAAEAAISVVNQVYGEILAPIRQCASRVHVPTFNPQN
jgi:hypothetical protein